jgi:DNA-binding transcriptional LysR family regulator
MQNQRAALSPDALALLQAVAEHGSFAAAARSLGLVPSALSYRVRQLEEALDVLLFDRSARQARLTPAGAELLREGQRLLLDMDAVARRVKRIATGWEPQLTLALDTIISRSTVLELCEQFFALGAPTRLRLREETLSGTLEALTSGQADLAIGVVGGGVMGNGLGANASSIPGIQSQPLGPVAFVYAVAPHHPLAAAPEPLADEVIRQHRAVAVADTVQQGLSQTVGLLPGQEVFTVPHMQAKLEAQLRGLGGGNLPRRLAQPYIDSGLLITRRLQRSPDGQTEAQAAHYAWRQPSHGKPGRALQWWLERLAHSPTREAVLNRP